MTIPRSCVGAWSAAGRAVAAAYRHGLSAKPASMKTETSNCSNQAEHSDMQSALENFEEIVRARQCSTLIQRASFAVEWVSSTSQRTPSCSLGFANVSAADSRPSTASFAVLGATKSSDSISSLSGTTANAGGANELHGGEAKVLAANGRQDESQRPQNSAVLRQARLADEGRQVRALRLSILDRRASPRLHQAAGSRMAVSLVSQARARG